MALNSFVRSLSSIRSVAHRGQSQGAISLPYLRRFSTAAKDMLSIIESDNDHFDPYPDIPDRFPFSSLGTGAGFHPNRKKMISGTTFERNVKDETIRITVVEDIYKVTDGIPSVSMHCSIVPHKGICWRPRNFELTAEPEKISIHSFQISGPFEQQQFEEYLGAKGINTRSIDILFDYFKQS